MSADFPGTFFFLFEVFLILNSYMYVGFWPELLEKDKSNLFLSHRFKWNNIILCTNIAKSVCWFDDLQHYLFTLGESCLILELHLVY